MKKMMGLVLTLITSVSILFLLATTVNAASLTPGNIDACGELDTQNGEYTLNQSVSASGTCFTIESSNVTLNGDGFNVTYGTGSGAPGVKINSNLINITVKNLVIKKSGSGGSTNHGIQIDTGTNDSLITNNSIRTNGSSTNFGIYLNNFATNNTISFNNITSGGTSNSYTIYLITNSKANHVVSNIVSSQTSSNFNNAIQLSKSTENIIEFNNVTSGGNTNGVGINLQLDSNNNTINSNIINTNAGSGSHGVNIQTGSSFNNITSNTINTTGSNTSHGLNIVSTTSIDNIYSSNTFGDIAGFTVNFATAGIIGTIFTNQAILNYTFIGAGSKITLENTSYAKIVFAEELTGNGANLFGTSNSQIVFGNNSVSLNSTTNSGLNVTANITIYGVGDRGFSDPVILKDGELCDDCSNFTSLIDDTVIFNVTSWSNYSVGDVVTTATVVVVEEEEEETSSGSAGGGGYPWFRPTDKLLNKGYNKKFQENWGILFELEHTTASFLVESISDNLVKVSINPLIGKSTLSVGQENLFDLTGDGNSDILVRLNSVDTRWWKNQADISITLMNEKLGYESTELSLLTTASSIDADVAVDSVQEETSKESRSTIVNVVDETYLVLWTLFAGVFIYLTIFRKYEHK